MISSSSAFLVSDAQLRCPFVRNKQGFPHPQGQVHIKKLAQKIRLASWNIGCYIGKSVEFVNIIKKRIKIV